MHGITIQEGPDGNSDSMPTYWFWHPWACAGNKTGCPWIGHANASRIFDSYLVTVGHGAVLNINIPPERTGRMNASVAAVMHEVGKALNDTFGKHLVRAADVNASCELGAVNLDLPEVGSPFDYIVTMEDLKYGQRIANYSIDFQRRGSSSWETLVPPVWKKSTLEVGDRPDGHDPRDQYIGHKRIDLPNISRDTFQAISKVRFNCLRSLHGSDIFIRSFALHRKHVPWEKTALEVAFV